MTRLLINFFMVETMRLFFPSLDTPSRIGVADMGRKATFILFFPLLSPGQCIYLAQKIFLSLFTRLTNGDGAGWWDGILEVLLKALRGGLFIFYIFLG